MNQLPNETIEGEGQTALDSALAISAWDALSEAERYRMIAEAAYFRAERRGFASGSELQDWIEAVEEVKKRFGKA